MAAKPIPDDYQSLTPYIVVDGAAKAIEFYKQAFGATERGVMQGPDGKIMHGEIQIGDSVLMLSDNFPFMDTKAPADLGATTGELFLYVEDVDATFKQALDAGAEETRAVEDQFWGDRFGKLKDPFGQVWALATHVEDVPQEEMEERAKQAMAQMG